MSFIIYKFAYFKTKIMNNVRFLCAIYVCRGGGKFQCNSKVYDLLK